MRSWYGATVGDAFYLSYNRDKITSIKLLHVCPLQRLLTLSPNQRKNVVQANQKETGTVERLAPATLKEFSLIYFR